MSTYDKQAAPTVDRSIRLCVMAESLLGGRCRGAVVAGLGGVGMVRYTRVAQETTGRVHDRVDLCEGR